MALKHSAPPNFSSLLRPWHPNDLLFSFQATDPKPKKKLTARKSTTQHPNHPNRKLPGKLIKTPAQKRKSKDSVSGPPGSARKKIRFRPGTVALREIRAYQSRTELLIPKLPFSRLVKEIANERSSQGKHFKQKRSAPLRLFYT